MIVATDIELRAGARLLLEGASFQVAAGDRIGLVGRNGAGKTTLAKVLAGQAQPAAGSVRRSGPVGYLPQDPRTGDLDMLAIDRVLSARGLDQLRADLRAAEAQMSNPDSAAAAVAIRQYGRLEERLAVLGGYAAESQAASITASLGLPDRVLHQPLHTLSGGQRRRVELARILFSDSETMLLDEPTNHLDADSVVWLRDHLKSYRGGLVVISHDVNLLADVVNKVFYLDAQRAGLDMYNLGWRAYLQQRETDERRRRRERVNASRQASALMTQADKMRAKATKARAAQNMQRRAERLLAGVEAERSAGRHRPVQVVRVDRGVRRGGRRRRPGQPGRGARPQRRGEDHPAPAAGRAGNSGYRRSHAGTRPQPRILRPRA
jgi:ATPase subunit of ABC transporter with duplicated ATPase domains